MKEQHLQNIKLCPLSKLVKKAFRKSTILQTNEEADEWLLFYVQVIWGTHRFTYPQLTDLGNKNEIKRITDSRICTDQKEP